MARKGRCLDCPTPTEDSRNDDAGWEHPDEEAVVVDEGTQLGAGEGGEGLGVVNVGCNLDLRLEVEREHKAGCSKRDYYNAAAAAAVAEDEAGEAER